MKVILASRSPRRRQLLQMLAIEHEVRPADIKEDVIPGESPVEAATRLAAEKAALISAELPGRIVIGSDTVVVLEGEMLGKPGNETEAVEMLRSLSGRTHTVISGVAVVRDGRSEVDHDQTQVTFVSLDEDTIRNYVATGEPLDKAGAYGIQGYGSLLIERIDGDFFSVMGLPVRRMVRLMDSFGYNYIFTR